MRSLSFEVFTLHLRAEEAVSVGEPLRVALKQRMKPDESAVVPVAQDPFGNLVVRGTSVVGALRTHLSRYRLSGVERQFASIDSRGEEGDPQTRELTLADVVCGSEPEERRPSSTKGQPSKNPAHHPSPLRLVEVEVPCTEPGDVTVPTRVAISRHRGAAMVHKLFSREQVSALTLDVTLQIDLPILRARIVGDCGLTEDDVQRVLDDTAHAVSRWRPSLGGQRGVGLGQFELLTFHRGGGESPLTWAELLAAGSTVDLMRSRATTEAQVEELQVFEDVLAEAPEAWRWHIPLVCVDPLLVAPVTERDGDRETNRAPTANQVPGSTWRGVFRSRAEFILRSCGVKACLSTDEATCGECPTCELFGWTPPPGAPAHQVGARGLIRFLKSPIEGEKFCYTHAPIDRFTGGAAAGVGGMALFTRTSWAPGATLTLDVEQNDERRPVPEWARHLLSLVLRDLHDGWIGIGNSTTRGYGTVRVRDDQDLVDVPEGWLDAVGERSGTPTMTAVTA